MSWTEEYVEKQLVATQQVKEACILSAEDGALWASSPDSFVPRAYLAIITSEDGKEKEELVNEAADLAEVGRTMKAPRAGLRINQAKYVIIRATKSEDGLKTIQMKRVSGGGWMCVTRQTIIIGTFDEAMGKSAAVALKLLRILVTF